MPGLLLQAGDGSWDYSLLWMHLPDHKGDVVRLHFELPAGWRWTGDPPPAEVSLDWDIRGTWRLASGR